MALFQAVARSDAQNAITHTRLALDLDPRSVSTNFSAAWIYFFSRDYRNAVAQARATLAIDEQTLHAYYVLGWTALAESRFADAIAAFQKTAALSRDAISIAYLANAYARAAMTGEARALLEELQEKHRSAYVPEFLFAIVHAALGDTDRALEVLERCYASRDSRLFWFRVVPIAGSLINDCRFGELMQRVEAVLAASPGAAPR